MAVRKPIYESLTGLLAHELVRDEEPETAKLMQSLRHVKHDKVLTKAQLLAICRWKSPRAIRLVESNHTADIERLTRAAFSSRSERKRIEYLTSLHGVGLPMASAILTLVNPKRYGVIDIRVWQLLFAIKSVRRKPTGLGLSFRDWYDYLCKLRYHARQLGVPVRMVEYTLFRYHQRLQQGRLYDTNRFVEEATGCSHGRESRRPVLSPTVAGSAREKSCLSI